jgi:hypothetical protein
VISVNWKSKFRYLGISALFLFVISYNLRSSIETIHLARSLDFWLPFSVEPFSDHMQNVSSGIVSADPIAKTIPLNRAAPLHLLAINRRQFRGMSVYLTQLWNHHPTIGPDPKLQISMRYGDSRAFVASFLIPHCTCSTPSVWQLVQLFLLSPLFCVLLAFFIVLRRPGAIHVWGMSASLVAISQLDLFPHTASFQWTANTMAWTDWFRIPATAYRAFAQNIWPAALIITASHLLPVRPAARRYSRWVAALLLGWCLVQSLFAVGWSEYYLPFVPLYDFLQQHGGELTAVILVLVAAVCLVHNRTLGAIVLVLGLVASSVPYWPTLNITTAPKVALPAIGPLRPTVSAIYSKHSCANRFFRRSGSGFCCCDHSADSGLRISTHEALGVSFITFSASPRALCIGSIEQQRRSWNLMARRYVCSPLRRRRPAWNLYILPLEPP